MSYSILLFKLTADHYALPNTLQEAQVEVLSYEQCEAIFPPHDGIVPVTESNVCVGSAEGGQPNACSVRYAPNKFIYYRSFTYKNWSHLKPFCHISG